MKNLKRLVAILAILFCIAPRILHAQLTPPDDGGYDWPTNLNSWSFHDATDWTSDLGYAPVSFTNIDLAKLGDNGSMLLDSTNAAWLQYKIFENDGTTNLTVNQGTISFWFAPGSWASTNGGTGPGDWGRLIEVGGYTTNASYGWWSLFLDPGATNIYFGAQTNSGNGATSTYLSAPIAWNTNEWHFIGLTYSATNSTLYLDGMLVTNGLPVTVFPGLNVLTNGFYVGSDATGLLQAHGMLDDIDTFNYPLDSATVSNLFVWELWAYKLNPANTVGANLQSAPGSPNTNSSPFNAITGSGFLQYVGSASSCVTSSNVWITNMTCTVVGSGTNLTANYTFTIAGGSNGFAYDLFANAGLAPADPNFKWAWMGQGYTCSIYTVTNLPPGSAFMILGTPLNSDSDGLTDAYERLVSHTDPNIPDTSGDGILDGWKIFWGLNSFLNNPAQTSLRKNYTYDFDGWFKQVSGVKSGTVTLDNQGNVLTVSQ
jgi:concanavalin A-like lectin/glucanase superfamily protein